MPPKKIGYTDDTTGATATGAKPSQPIVTGDETGEGMVPLYGWAGKQGFVGSELANTIYQNPFSLLPNVFKGINTGTPGYEALRDIGADPVNLYNMMMGGRQSLAGETGVSDFTNWLRNMYKSYGSRGGGAFSAGDLLRTMYAQKAPQEGSKAPISALTQILQGLSPQDQAGTFYKLIRDITSVGMNPLAAVGYNAAAMRGADRYQNALLSSPAGEGASNMLITDWLRQNMPGLVPK